MKKATYKIEEIIREKPSGNFSHYRIYKKRRFIFSFWIRHRCTVGSVIDFGTLENAIRSIKDWHYRDYKKYYTKKEVVKIIQYEIGGKIIEEEK